MNINSFQLNLKGCHKLYHTHSPINPPYNKPVFLQYLPPQGEAMALMSTVHDA